LKLVAFGWGNDARGDDALGPLLLERVARASLEDVETIEDFQLQIEHALDLEGADLALFLDAGKDTPAPFAFAEIFARRDDSALTHALSPQAVLEVFARTVGRAPPPAFLLCVRGERFELGEGLSDPVRPRLDAACDFVDRLLRERSPETWRLAARDLFGD
jgi:hydrogenase maturation protease